MRLWLLVCSCLLVPRAADVVRSHERYDCVASRRRRRPLVRCHAALRKTVGRIEFALDPAAPQNARIVDLEYAPRAADGRVHFTADLHVLQPTDPAKGNGVLLFEAANRGNRVLGRFNNAGGGEGGRRRVRRRAFDEGRLHARRDRLGARACRAQHRCRRSAGNVAVELDRRRDRGRRARRCASDGIVSRRRKREAPRHLPTGGPRESR